MTPETENFTGAYPPPDNPAHRYIFTLHALSLDEINPDGMTSAYVRFNIMRNQLASASITGLFKNKRLTSTPLAFTPLLLFDKDNNSGRADASDHLPSGTKSGCGPKIAAPFLIFVKGFVP